MLGRINVLATSVVLALLVSGCGQAVLNIDSRSFTASDKVSLQDVEKAISTAASELGWWVRPVGRRKLQAKYTLHVSGRSATVSISYDTKAYSIAYKDSRKLGYTGTNIDPKYNSWINELVGKIDKNLSRI